MATVRLTAEHIARLFLIGLVLGLPLAVLIARAAQSAGGQTIELHGAMAETGGWTPADLTATVGQPLHLRLTSDDVVHGFAVGQTDWPAFNVEPGKVTETTLTFDRPGKYVFYCTRWCGPNHWRMRGTIEVLGPASEPLTGTPPLYLTLGLDIDAPHPASVTPDRAPSVTRGATLSVTLPSTYLTGAYYRTHSPAETWQALRVDPVSHRLSDAQVWDLVARVWQANTTPAALEEGRQIYAANCAACHGETGGGDGVMAQSLAEEPHVQTEHGIQPPADFTDATALLGASPALLQGKIVRGGMGTGMPYWGPIFTEAQTWAVVDYLWTFQFGEEGR